jgi:hypothetical protein
MGGTGSGLIADASGLSAPMAGALSTGPQTRGGFLAGVGRVLKGVVGFLIGENFGEAWRSFFSSWAEGPTGGFMPTGIAAILRSVRSMIPGNSAANGMHAWHAGSNAALAKALGLVGAPLILVAGILHETPLDFASFKGEQSFQGTINHALDSLTDIGANVFGMASGYLIPRSHAAVSFAIDVGNLIPGPGEPDPTFGGHGAYTGNPSTAWGQYP